MESVRKNPFETITSLAQTQIMSLGSELEYQAEALRDHPAIIFEDRIVTFGELNSQANRYANYFGSWA